MGNLRRFYPLCQQENGDSELSKERAAWERAKARADAELRFRTVGCLKRRWFLGVVSVVIVDGEGKQWFKQAKEAAELGLVWLDGENGERIPVTEQNFPYWEVGAGGLWRRTFRIDGKLSDYEGGAE